MYFRRGHGEFEGIPHLLARPLIVRKKEKLVPLDRTANRPSKDIGKSVRNIGTDRVVPRILREWITRLLRVAVPVIVNRAMELVRARFRLHHGHARDGSAELGIVVLIDEFQFLNRVKRWIDYDLTDKPIFVIGSIEHKAGGKGRLAVRRNGDRSLRILSIGIGKCRSRRSRCEQNQAGGISNQIRRFLDRKCIERCRDIRAIRF